jgi:hypothetical protein
MNIKENWEKKDEVCPYCGQITQQAKGITKQNLRKLLVPKWNMNELLITLLLLALILLAVAYRTETAACREWITPMLEGREECLFICNSRCAAIHTEVREFDFTINISNLGT